MPWRTFLRPCSCSTGGVGGDLGAVGPGLLALLQAAATARGGLLARAPRCARPGAPRACASGAWTPRPAGRRRAAPSWSVGAGAAGAASSAGASARPRPRSARRPASAASSAAASPRRLSAVSSTFSFSVSFSVSASVDLHSALAGDRQRPGEVALGGAHAGRVLELARGVREAQAEQLAALRADVLERARSRRARAARAAFMPRRLRLLAGDELRLDRQLLDRQAHRVAGERLVARRPART